jgi:hypothetical protein
VHDREALWLAHQRRQWMLPDPSRWLQPDQSRFQPLQPYERKYAPDQPRVPAGSPEGGRWTGEGGEGSGNDRQMAGPEKQPARTQIAQAETGTATDVDGTPYYKPGGHHEIPKAIYEKWNLPPETRKVFDQATTGTVPKMFLRTTPDGVPVGNFWDGPNGAHGIYTTETEELSKQFLQKNNIQTEKMTSDQARALLKEVRETENPVIRNFNGTMRLLRRLFPLRAGRGLE